MSIKKTQYCQNNTKNSDTEKKAKHINLQDMHGVQYTHLMIQKTNTIFIDETIVLKSYVKI